VLTEMFVFAAVFCGYYDPDNECEWRYKSCGPTCIKTCRNPSGTCSDQIPPLEGYIDLLILRTYFTVYKCPTAEDFFFTCTISKK